MHGKVRSGKARSGAVRSGRARSGAVRSGRARTGAARSGQVWSGLARRGLAWMKKGKEFNSLPFFYFLSFLISSRFFLNSFTPFSELLGAYAFIRYVVTTPAKAKATMIKPIAKGLTFCFAIKILNIQYHINITI
jgi:hypothetical protein